MSIELTQASASQKQGIRNALGIELSQISVSGNADKLALTGIYQGQCALITGEANRLEMFIGSDPSLDSDWEVIGQPTYQISVLNNTASNVQFNGVEVAPNGDFEFVTWVKYGEPFYTTGTNWAQTQIVGISVSLDTIGLKFDGLAAEDAQPNFMKIGGSGYYVPLPFPNRADLRVYTY